MSSLAWDAARILLIGFITTTPVIGETSPGAHAAAPNPVRLLLPPTLYAVPGVEANVYFANVMLALNPANYAVDVDCEKGQQESERWTYLPAAEDTGSYALTLRVVDATNQVIAESVSTVRVVSPTDFPVETVSTLLIGDSLTHASIYSATLLEHFSSADSPALSLVGTHAPKDDPANRHEGYGGWTAERFATHFTGAPRDAPYKERPSPFVYGDDAENANLDFGRYCAENTGGEAPDVVTIFLGCNDTFSATEENIEARIDTMFTHMDALIAMVHGVDKDTRIGLIAPVPPSASQDAFGANYKNGQTRWQYRRNQHRVVERMMETYGGREGEHLSLIPAYVNLDCERNYPSAAPAPANARSEALVARQNNGVHPSAPGYRQIGDSVFAWIVAGLEEE